MSMRSALILQIAVSTAPSPEPPAPLACLVRLYEVRDEKRGGGWTLVLPDGTAIPYDDGRSKTLEEKLDAPDVEDAFSIPYRTGPIAPVTEAEEDPGRVRLDPLLRAIYAPGGTVDLVEIAFLDQKLRVHRRTAPAFERVARRLEEAVALDSSLLPFLKGLGTFLRRNIAGTDRPSPHSWGIALDLNAALSDYWRWGAEAKRGRPLRWRNRVPGAIVDAFEAEGFIWGGRWYHYDTMHFEWRPELLSQSCYPER